MGRIEATGLAYWRSVRGTNPAVAEEDFHIHDSLTNWRLALVCRPDPARLSPASEALAGAGGTSWSIGQEIKGCSRVAKNTRRQHEVGNFQLLSEFVSIPSIEQSEIADITLQPLDVIVELERGNFSTLQIVDSGSDAAPILSLYRDKSTQHQVVQDFPFPWSHHPNFLM
jgi:hypothetical protein